MRLAARAERLRSMFWPAMLALMGAVTVVGLGVGVRPGALFVALVVAGLVFMLGWPRLVTACEQRFVAAHWRAVAAAYEEEDPAVLDGRYQELEEYFRRFTANTVSALELCATRACYRESWAEARAILGKIDRERLQAGGRIRYDNLLAWALAHDGAAPDAVTLARTNCSRADLIEEDARSYLHGTLGVALFFAGDPIAAVAPLRTAIELGGPRWAQALRHYYLGEVLWAQSHIDEARAAWEKACALTPRGRWATRAREKLAAPLPPAYR